MSKTGGLILSFDQPFQWLMSIMVILALILGLPWAVAQLTHWEADNFFLHGGIWAIIILMLNVGLKFCGTGAVDIRIRSVPAFAISLILILTGVFALAVTPLRLWRPIALGALNAEPFGLTPTPLTFLLFVVVLPLIEEFFFRGILLGQMLYKFNVTKAIVLSSFLYALSQWGNEHLLIAFLLGVVTALLYVITRSLLSGILFHIAWNFFIFFSWLDDVTLETVAKNGWADLKASWLLGEVALVIGMAGIFYLMHGLFARHYRGTTDGGDLRRRVR